MCQGVLSIDRMNQIDCQSNLREDCKICYQYISIIILLSSIMNRGSAYSGNRPTKNYIISYMLKPGTRLPYGHSAVFDTNSVSDILKVSMATVTN